MWVMGCDSASPSPWQTVVRMPRALFMKKQVQWRIAEWIGGEPGTMGDTEMRSSSNQTRRPTDEPRNKLPSQQQSQAASKGIDQDHERGIIMKTANRNRGQSLVELSVGLIFIMTIMAGIVDVGRGLFAQVVLLDAAEEGAMYGSSMPTDAQAIESRVRDNSEGLVDLADLENVLVTVEYPGGACAGHILRVRVDHTMMITTPFLGTILGSQSFPLSATAESMILAPECN